MGRKFFVTLYILGVVLSIFCAIPQQSPGYMDADYYFAGGLSLSQGLGFFEPFIWNFLNQPTGIPTPSHTYWMPLPSILAAVGLLFDFEKKFIFAKIPFILLSGLVPVLSAYLAYHLSKNRFNSMIAGLLGLTSGFYILYVSLPESFVIYMVLGSLLMGLLDGSSELIGSFLASRSGWRYLVIGLVAGGMHLTRADGIIFLLLAIAVLILQTVKSRNFLITAKFLLLVIAGYGVVMGFWYTRNLQLFGTLLPPGGALSVWMTRYDQLFMYPPDQVSFSAWLSHGWINILTDRLDALSTNLKTALAVQGEIILFPLVILGIRRCRSHSAIKIGVAAWVIILLLMTVVFPFAGSRGGFFHSASSVQILFWALAPCGLEQAIELARRLRKKWDSTQAKYVFGSGVVIICLGLSAFLYVTRVLGPDPSQPIWNQNDRHYRAVEKELRRLGAKPYDRVLVNNPPGYYVANRREAVVIADGDLNTQYQVARQFQASYLILEKNHPTRLSWLYDRPADQPNLIYLANVDGTYIYMFENLVE